MSCAEGDEGFVYAGKLDFEHQVHALDNMPDIPLKIMMNVGNPDRAFSFARLPHQGVGLARLEFIINNLVGIHPKALLAADSMSDRVQQVIHEKTTMIDAHLLPPEVMPKKKARPRNDSSPLRSKLA